MTSPTLPQIVEGLTPSMRRAIVDADGGFVALKWGTPNVIGALAEQGLVPPRCRGQEQDFRLTAKGIQVRTHLLSLGEGM